MKAEDNFNGSLGVELGVGGFRWKCDIKWMARLEMRRAKRRISQLNNENARA